MNSDNDQVMDDSGTSPEILDSTVSRIWYSVSSVPVLFWNVFCSQLNPLMKLYYVIVTSLDGSRGKQRKLLCWLEAMSGREVRDLQAVWQDGSIVCDIINAVMVGNCEPKDHHGNCLRHAQELASHHFKLLPVFSNSELQKPFNSNFEKRLWRYLLALRNALKHRLANNMADQDEKDPEYLIAEEYVARGMGLILASRGERAIFFIYSRDDSSLADIHIHVKGPNGDCGEATAGEPIDSQHHSIAIDYRLTPDYLKVCYIPNSLGRHELSLTRYGFNIPGSPFIIKVGEHTGPPAEKFSYLDWLTEEQEEEQRLEIERKRKLKVVSRVIDFITEKMHMTEDGQLVKFDNNSSLRVPSPIPHNPKRTGRSLSPRSRCKLSSQRRSKSLTNQKLIQAAEFLKFSKEEKKCVQDAASQVSEDFSMIQPVGIDQFQEKCQRIVRACDFLLSHAPEQKSLEILTTAEKILDIPYNNTLTHHKSLFELYRPEFETPDINLQNLTTESSRSSETDDDKEVIKPCTPEINVTRVDFSDRLYSMRRYDDLGLNAVSDFNNDSTANENISTPQLNREKNRSKSTSPQKDARMARKSFQTVGYTKAKRSSQTSIPTNNLSDEIGLSDNTNENIEENSINIIDDGICLSDNKNGNIGGQSTKKIDDSMSLNDIKNENHERNSTSYIGDEICLTSDETGRVDAEEKKEAQHQLIGEDENLPIVSVVETNVDHSEKHAEDEISFEHSSTRLSRNRQPKITRNSKQAKTVSNLVKQFENQSVCSNVSLVGNELSSDLKTNGDENAIGNSMESSIDNNDSNKTNCVMTGDNLKTEIKNDDREMRSRVIDKKSIEKTDETEKIVQETEICEPKNIISDESTLSTSDKSKENMELITGEQNITINEQTGTINEQNITVDEQIVNEIDEKTKKIVIIGDENIIGRERKDESNAQDKIDDFIRNSEKHLEIAENNDSNSSSRQLNKDENKTLAENIPQIDIEKEAGENDTLQETSYKEEVKVPTSIKSRISAFEDYSRKIENDSLLNKKFKKGECVADEKLTSNEDGVIVNENDSESVAENKSNQLGDIEYPSEVTVVKDSINKSVEDYIKSMNEVLDEVEELSNSNFVENFEDKNKKVENEKIEDKTHFEMIEEIQKSNANVDDSVECSGKQEEREFKSENELILENPSQNIGEEHSATVDALNGECVLLSMKHLSFDDDQSLQASDFVKLKDFEIVDKTILSEEEYGTPIWVNEIIIPIEKGELVENHELNDSENLVTPELISEQEVVVIRDDIEVTNRDQDNKDIDIITGLIQDSITDKKLLAFDNETSNGSDNNLSSITEQELKLKTNIKNPENVDHLLKTEQITATPSIGFIEPEESIPLESPENTTITEDRPTDLIILENKSGNDEHEVVQVLKPSAFNTNSTLEDNEEYVTYLNEQLPIVNEKINVSPSDIETDDQKNNLLPRESVISDTTSKDGLNDGSATPEIILKEDVIEQKSDDKIENVESLSENVTEEDFKTITNASHDTLEIITIENQNQESPFTNEEEFDMDVNENKNLRSTISVVEELRKSLGIACVAHPKVVNFEIKCDNTLSENPECKVNLVTDVTVSEDVREYNLNETGEATENENEDIPDEKDEITVKHDDHDFQKIGIDKNVDEKDIELNPDITQNTDISGNAVNSLINETVDCSEHQEIISSEFFVTNNYEDEKIIDIENIEQSLEDPVIINEKINDSIIPPEVDHTLENIISSGDKVLSNVNVNEVENLNKNEKNGDCLMKDPEGSIETVVIDEGNTCVLPVDIELEAEEKKFKIQQQEEIKINRSSDEIENDISTDLAEQEVNDRVLVVATKDGNETKVGNLESEKEQIMVEIITEEDILKDDEKELILPVKIDEKDENEHITIEGEASNENVASVEETEADNLVLDSAEIALAEIDVETNIKQVEEIESSVEHCSSILKQAGVEYQKLDSIETNAEDLLKNTIEDEPIEQELLLASDDQKANNKEVDSNYEEVILEDHVKYNSIVFNSQGQEIEIESAKVEEEKLVAVSDEGQLISGSSDQETKNEEDYSFDKITKLEEPVIEVIAENDVVINSVTEIQNLETSNSNKEISKEADDQKDKVHFEAENKGEHLIGDTEVTEISLANIKLEDNSLINDKSNKLDQIIIDEKIEKNIEVYRNSLTEVQNFEASNSNEEISEETVQQKDKVYFEAENKGEDLICVTEISEIGQLNAKLEEDSSDGKQPNDLHQITSDNKPEELEKILEEVENLEEVTNDNEFKVESEINIISDTSKAVMITEDQVPQTFEFDNDHIETKVEIIIVNTATTPAQIGIESDDNSTESIKLMECLSQNETPNNVEDESHIIEEEITLEQYSGNNLGEEIENDELLVVSGADENRLPQSENLPFESGLQSAAVLEKTTYEECVQENENIMKPVDNDVKISNEEGELPIEAGSVSQFSDEGISRDTESNGCFLGSNVGIKETAEEKFVKEDNRIKREKEIIGKNEKSENIIGVTDTFENDRGDNSLEEINCQKNLDELAENLCNISARISVEDELKDINSGDFVECKFGVEPVEKIITEVIFEDIKTELALQHNEIDNKMDIEGDISFLIDSTKDSTIIEDNVGDLGDKLNFIDSAGDEYENLTEIPCKVQKTENQSQADSGEIYTGEEFDINLEPTSELNEIDISLNETTLKQNEVGSTLGKDIETNLETSLGEKAAQKIIKADLCENTDEVEMETNINLDDVGSKINSNLQKDVEINNDTLYLNDDQETVNSENELEMKDDSKEMKESDISNENNANLKISSDSNLEESSPIANVEDRNDKNLIINSYLEQSGPTKDLIANVEDESNLFDESTQLIDVDEKIENEIISVLNEENVEDTCTNTEDENMENISNSEISSEPQSSLLLEKNAKIEDFLSCDKLDGKLEIDMPQSHEKDEDLNKKKIVVNEVHIDDSHKIDSKLISCDEKFENGFSTEEPLEKSQPVNELTKTESSSAELLVELGDDLGNEQSQALLEKSHMDKIDNDLLKTELSSSELPAESCSEPKNGQPQFPHDSEPEQLENIEVTMDLNKDTLDSIIKNGQENVFDIQGDQYVGSNLDTQKQSKVENEGTLLHIITPSNEHEAEITGKTISDEMVTKGRSGENVEDSTKCDLSSNEISKEEITSDINISSIDEKLQNFNDEKMELNEIDCNNEPLLSICVENSNNSSKNISQVRSMSEKSENCEIIEESVPNSGPGLKDSDHELKTDVNEIQFHEPISSVDNFDLIESSQRNEGLFDKELVDDIDLSFDGVNPSNSDIDEERFCGNISKLDNQNEFFEKSNTDLVISEAIEGKIEENNDQGPSSVEILKESIKFDQTVENNQVIIEQIVSNTGIENVPIINKDEISTDLNICGSESLVSHEQVQHEDSKVVDCEKVTQNNGNQTNTIKIEKELGKIDNNGMIQSEFENENKTVLEKDIKLKVIDVNDDSIPPVQEKFAANEITVESSSDVECIRNESPSFQLSDLSLGKQETFLLVNSPKKEPLSCDETHKTGVKCLIEKFTNQITASSGEGATINEPDIIQCESRVEEETLTELHESDQSRPDKNNKLSKLIQRFESHAVEEVQPNNLLTIEEVVTESNAVEEVQPNNLTKNEEVISLDDMNVEKNKFIELIENKVSEDKETIDSTILKEFEFGPTSIPTILTDLIPDEKTNEDKNFQSQHEFDLCSIGSHDDDVESKSYTDINDGCNESLTQNENFGSTEHLLLCVEGIEDDEIQQTGVEEGKNSTNVSENSNIRIDGIVCGNDKAVGSIHEIQSSVFEFAETKNQEIDQNSRKIDSIDLEISGELPVIKRYGTSNDLLADLINEENSSQNEIEVAGKSLVSFIEIDESINIDKDEIVSAETEPGEQNLITENEKSKLEILCMDSKNSGNIEKIPVQEIRVTQDESLIIIEVPVQPDLSQNKVESQGTCVEVPAKEVIESTPVSHETESESVLDGTEEIPTENSEPRDVCYEILNEISTEKSRTEEDNLLKTSISDKQGTDSTGSELNRSISLIVNSSLESDFNLQDDGAQISECVLEVLMSNNENLESVEEPQRDSIEDNLSTEAGEACTELEEKQVTEELAWLDKKSKEVEEPASLSSFNLWPSNTDSCPSNETNPTAELSEDIDFDSIISAPSLDEALKKFEKRLSDKMSKDSTSTIEQSNESRVIEGEKVENIKINDEIMIENLDQTCINTENIPNEPDMNNEICLLLENQENNYECSIKNYSNEADCADNEASIDTENHQKDDDQRNTEGSITQSIDTTENKKSLVTEISQAGESDLSTGFDQLINNEEGFQQSTCEIPDYTDEIIVNENFENETNKNSLFLGNVENTEESAESNNLILVDIKSIDNSQKESNFENEINIQLDDNKLIEIDDSKIELNVSRDMTSFLGDKESSVMSNIEILDNKELTETEINEKEMNINTEINFPSVNNDVLTASITETFVDSKLKNTIDSEVESSSICDSHSLLVDVENDEDTNELDKKCSDNIEIINNDISQIESFLDFEISPVLGNTENNKISITIESMHAPEEKMATDTSNFVEDPNPIIENDLLEGCSVNKQDDNELIKKEMDIFPNNDALLEINQTPEVTEMTIHTNSFQLESSPPSNDDQEVNNENIFQTDDNIQESEPLIKYCVPCDDIEEVNDQIMFPKDDEIIQESEEPPIKYCVPCEDSKSYPPLSNNHCSRPSSRMEIIREEAEEVNDDQEVEETTKKEEERLNIFIDSADDVSVSDISECLEKFDSLIQETELRDRDLLDIDDKLVTISVTDCDFEEQSDNLSPVESEVPECDRMISELVNVSDLESEHQFNQDLQADDNVLKCEKFIHEVHDIVRYDDLHDKSIASDLEEDSTINEEDLIENRKLESISVLEKELDSKAVPDDECKKKERKPKKSLVKSKKMFWDEKLKSLQAEQENKSRMLIERRTKTVLKDHSNKVIVAQQIPNINKNLTQQSNKIKSTETEHKKVETTNKIILNKQLHPVNDKSSQKNLIAEETVKIVVELSDENNRNLEDRKSVDNWKNYWNNLLVNEKDEEVQTMRRQPSIRVQGIVASSRNLFERTNTSLERSVSCEILSKRCDLNNKSRAPARSVGENLNKMGLETPSKIQKSEEENHKNLEKSESISNISERIKFFELSSTVSNIEANGNNNIEISMTNKNKRKSSIENTSIPCTPTTIKIDYFDDSQQSPPHQTMINKKMKSESIDSSDGDMYNPLTMTLSGRVRSFSTGKIEETPDDSLSNIEEDRSNKGSDQYLEKSDEEIKKVGMLETTPLSRAKSEGNLSMNEKITSRARFEQAKSFFKCLEEENLVKSKVGDDYLILQKPGRIKQISMDSDSCGEGCKPKKKESKYRRRGRRRRRDPSIMKVRSAPTSDSECRMSMYDSEFGGSLRNKSKRVAERFHVKHLFRDISGDTDGIFKGIPNRKAVLASLEDLRADSVPDESQDCDEPSRSQSLSSIPSGYQDEYPYLPTTPPSQYRHRSQLEDRLISRCKLVTYEMEI